MVGGGNASKALSAYACDHLEHHAADTSVTPAEQPKAKRGTVLGKIVKGGLTQPAAAASPPKPR